MTGNRRTLLQKRTGEKPSRRLRKGLAFLLCLCVFFSAFAVMAAAAPLHYGSDRGCRSQVFDLATINDLPSDGRVGRTALAQSTLLGAASTQPDSYIPLVMIVIGFNGQAYNPEYDWGTLFFEGSTSLAQYYMDMSFGQFTFLPVQETSAYGVDGNTSPSDQENDGIIHVQLSTTKQKGWALSNYDRAADLENMKAFADALSIAGEYMDFSAYDSNGDGMIQNSELAVGFVVAGHDAAYVASISALNKKYFSWPNAFSFSECRDMWKNNLSGFPEVPVIDGVKVDAYIAIAECYDANGRYNSSGNNIKQETIGTLAHELGHYLGLPDLYDTGSSGGAWSKYECLYLSLMDSGCYGEDLSGNSLPFSLDIWSRVRLGWVEPVTLEPDTDPVSIAGSFDRYADDPIVLRVNTPRENEYYLIENRRFTGWDAGMGGYYSKAATSGGEDRGGGLILWHIDEDIIDAYNDWNTVNNANHRPGVMPLYWEYSSDGIPDTVGITVKLFEPFFDGVRWGSDLALPLYYAEDLTSDTPADRIRSGLLLGMDTGSQPVMQVDLEDATGILSPPGSGSEPGAGEEIPEMPDTDEGRFDMYKDALLTVIDSYREEDDSAACRAVIDGAVAALGALDYDEAKPLEENKAAADAIVSDMIADLYAQRQEEAGSYLDEEENELLAEAFEAYKAEQIAYAESLGTEEDSEACRQLIADAVAAIEDEIFDPLWTYDDNTARVDGIVEKLANDLAAQRDKEAREREEAERWQKEYEEWKRQWLLEQAEARRAEQQEADSWACPFTDVSPEDPFFADVRFVYTAGLMIGVSDDMFDPAGTLTRGAIVTILYRLEGEPETAQADVFTDVSQDGWYAKGVSWAASKGIVMGYGDGTFDPDGAVTREQLATILYRYANSKGYDTSVGADTNILSYDDAFDISGWANAAMCWACGAGIYGDGYVLRPAEPATRAEVAGAIHVFMTEVVS